MHLQINYYTPSQPTDNDDNWCRLNLTLQSKEWLNYKIANEPILMSCEVEYLLDNLVSLLSSDNIPKAFDLEFTEPDLTFSLYPKQDVRNNSSILYIKSGNEIIDIALELQVHFWSDVLSANYLTLSFNRVEIQYLVIYLKLVTNKLTTDDKTVQLLLAQEIISI